MKFPILVFNPNQRNPEVIQEYSRSDELYYSNDVAYFNQHFLNCQVIDSSGEIFRISGLETEKKKKVFGTPKNRIIFSRAGEKVSIEALKAKLKNFILKLDIHEANLKSTWKSQIQAATSFQEIIEAM